MLPVCCCHPLGQGWYRNPFASAHPQDNGGLPLAAHRCRVDLDAVASRETLAVAWRQLQTKHAAEHPPLPADLVWQSPQHHATLAYLCGEWEYQGGHTVHTAAELVRQSRLWKLIPQVRPAAARS